MSTLPASDVDLLSAASLTLAPHCLWIRVLRPVPRDPPADRLPRPLEYRCWRTVPRGAGEVRSTAAPYLTSLDASPGLAAALVRGRLVGRVNLGIASTLYDVLLPAGLFDVPRREPKELALVLAPDVDAQTRRRLSGVLAKSGEGPEVLELQ